VQGNFKLLWLIVEDFLQSLHFPPTLKQLDKLVNGTTFVRVYVGYVIFGRLDCIQILSLLGFLVSKFGTTI
jgi:hypothetical protein